MSLTQDNEGAAAFDFGPDHTFSVADVSEKILWALVDAKHGGDWRADVASEDTARLSFHANRLFDGEHYEVILQAIKLDFPEGEEEGVSIAEINIEKTVAEPEAKEVLLGAAKKAAAEFKRIGELNGDEDSDYFDIPNVGDDKINVRKGTKYVCDTDAGWESDSYRVIDTSLVEIKVPLIGAEAELIDEEHIREHDLDIIQTACHILNAPAAIFKALQHIRANPEKKDDTDPV